MTGIDKELIKAGWCTCKGKRPHKHLTECIIKMLRVDKNES